MTASISPPITQAEFFAKYIKTGKAPPCAYDYEALASEACRALWARKDGYPARVKAGKMDADEASKDIAAWEAITADWDWIATGIGQPTDRYTLFDRIDALDQSLEHILAAQREDEQRGKRDDTLATVAGLQAVMRWHCEIEKTRPSTATVRWCAGVTHYHRASINAIALGAYPKRKAA